MGTKMVNRRQFLGAAAAAAAPFQPAPAPGRPNMILILADDLGYGDLGCYGQPRIHTPNLDRMSAEGIRFTAAYAGSTVCAPSRCSLMTGLHTGHARTRGNRSPDLPLRPEDITFTEILKRAGYRTALFGKWSLGELGSTGYPTRKGFDEWFGFFSQVHAHNYYPEHLMDGETAWLCRGNMGLQRKDYAPDLFTARALQFLEKQDGSNPFFLHLCYTAPHANNEMGRDSGDGMEVPSYGPYANLPWPRPEKGFAAMISRMDADIGRILETLKRRGLDDNTLVLFTSDNGPHKEGGHDPKFFESSGPLRGIKRDLTEGGIRVPMLARWPARIRAGQTSSFPWAFWDIFPTFAELAGAKAPAGLDGMSVVPTLLGQSQKPHEYFYWEFHEGGFSQAVRLGPWKGIRKGLDGPIELYNLDEDLGERRNLAADKPQIVASIARLMQEARTESEFWPVKPRA
jgi:arylsulfatase A-like enzyme